MAPQAWAKMTFYRCSHSQCFLCNINMNSEQFKKRFEAVFLHSHPLGPKLSLQATANYIKKSKAFVNQWVEQYNREKNVNDQPNVKPNRATTSQQDMRIVNLFEQNPGMSLNQGVERLSRRGLHVSPSTVRRRLIAATVRYRPTIKKPLLTQLQIEKRMRWATENLTTDWSKVMYTDESSFWLSNSLTHTWSTAKNRTVVRTVKHPLKVHVYGAFCEAGFGKLTVFTGNLNAARMLELYKSTLLPTAKKFYGNDNSNWQLLEDNDPKHKSRLCTAWKDENDIHQMVWPPQSPDCNPIENVWAIIKGRLKGKRIRTTRQLSSFIQRQWKSFSRDYAENLSKSMPSRCARVIEKQGEWIKY
jgi:transposase